MNFLMLVLNEVLPPGSREGPEYRKRVEWLVLLRLLVTSFLLLLTVVFQFTLNRSFFGDPVTPLYIILGTTYLLSLIYALAIPWISDLRVFSFVQILIDAVYVSALIAFTGGASSAFTLLYLFPIIAAGVLLLKRGALLLASASSMIFGLFVTLHFYRILPEPSWPWMDEWRNHDPGFVLWVLIIHFTIFFFVAVLAGSVAQQLASTRISLGLREIAFEKLSELHTNIVESISAGIATTDEEDRITFVNVPGRLILGMTLSDLIKTPIDKIFPDVTGGYSADPIGKLTHVIVSKISEEDRTIEYGVTQLKERDGKAAGRLVVFQDVTEIKKMEERAKLSEKQESFVRIAAGMAHEIRNPLASLRGAAELLSQPVRDTGHQQKLLGIVVRESDRLNSLLNDFILTVNNKPAYKLRVSLGDLVQETVELVTDQLFSSRGLALKTSISEAVEIMGEPERLKLAIRNLLGNAAEASPDGSVVQVTVGSDADQAVLIVADAGPGIPVEMRDRIFEPFVSTRDFGTGLGLPLILSTVEAHNGTIEMQSAEGQGAVFILRFPLASQDVINQIEEGDNV